MIIALMTDGIALIVLPRSNTITITITITIDG
jgi:hypothetical protein